MKPNLLKSFVYATFLVISAPGFSQFNDDFTDGDFTSNPVWKGDSAHFTVNPDLQLQLKAPAVTGKSYLYTASSVTAGGVWNFRLQTDFNPSSGNYAKVYLMSDKPKPDTVNGYFLRLGSTSDDISLFRQDGVNTKIIVDGRNGMLNASVNRIRVKISRSFTGEWTILCDTAGNTDYSYVGTGIDSTYWHSRYFGIQCIYTSTRSTRFIFDDFHVTGRQSADTIPPSLKGWQMRGDSVLELTFSEHIQLPTAENFNFSSGMTPKVVKTEGNMCLLWLSEKVPCRPGVDVSIKGIKDLTGNQAAIFSLRLTFCPGKVHDVLITEVMADPDPPVHLPNAEYIELFNRSGGELNLEKWILQAGNSKIILPAIRLPHDSFLVVCSPQSCGLFKNINLCAGLLPSGSLNNLGTYVGLKNRQGNLIHWMEYDESTYRDALKNSGGWSLEIADTDNPCVQQGNWKASTDYRGGTPGEKNSGRGTVNDLKLFQVIRYDLPDDHTVRLWFSKSPRTEDITENLFYADGNLGKPLKTIADSTRNMFVDLVFTEPLLPDKKYTLQISGGITGCSGEALQEPLSLIFMKGRLPQAGDILLNEILFDAPPGGQEFVEIYNRSNRYISSSELRMAYKGINSQYATTVAFGDYAFVIAPQEFVVLVKNPDAFAQQYALTDIRTVVECKNLPALSNEDGCVALMDKSLGVLDEFCYSSKMHHSLLMNRSGVSLERIRYDQPSGDRNNWHSAASSHGFATPGSENSQFRPEDSGENAITLEFEIFSPDNDGYKDVQTLFYQLDQPGFAAGIVVFDAMGRRVKVLSNNKILGTAGAFTWDGTDEKGRLAQTGIYLIYVALHHPSGMMKQYRKTCVLVGTLKR